MWYFRCPSLHWKFHVLFLDKINGNLIYNLCSKIHQISIRQNHRENNQAFFIAFFGATDSVYVTRAICLCHKAANYYHESIKKSIKFAIRTGRWLPARNAFLCSYHFNRIWSLIIVAEDNWNLMRNIYFLWHLRHFSTEQDFMLWGACSFCMRIHHLFFLPFFHRKTESEYLFWRDLFMASLSLFQAIL